jgi:hypothetical protein
MKIKTSLEAFASAFETPIDAPPVTLEAWWRGSGNLDNREPDITATIITPHLLAQHYTVSEDLQEQFRQWQESQDEFLSWFDLAVKFLNSRNFFSAARDNTCNHECDLNQVFIWQVFQAKDEDRDWIYDRDAIVVIFPHLGGDIRHSYGGPVFCFPTGETTVPTSFCASWHIVKGQDAGGETLSDDDCQALCERWQSGYSASPSSRFSDDVESILAHTQTEITVVLKSGETVIVCPDLPY